MKFTPSVFCSFYPIYTESITRFNNKINYFTMKTATEPKWVKIRSIENVNDVKRFFRKMNVLYGLCWDPDEDFEDVENYDIPPIERERIVMLMNQSFEVCEKNNIDIYDLGMEINYPLRKLYGIGTDELQH